MDKFKKLPILLKSLIITSIIFIISIFTVNKNIFIISTIVYLINIVICVLSNMKEKNITIKNIQEINNKLIDENLNQKRYFISSLLSIGLPMIIIGILIIILNILIFYFTY